MYKERDPVDDNHDSTYDDDPVESLEPRQPDFNNSFYSMDSGQPQFNGEHYNFQLSVSKSDFTAHLKHLINKCPLSPRLKRYLEEVVDNYFSQSAVLSNQSNTEIPKTHMEISLNLADLYATKEDGKRPEYLGLKNTIKSHIINFILTRAHGKERERIIMNRTSMEQISKMDDMEEKRQSRRGMGIVNRIFGGGDD